jgi:hypothetical protein
MNLACFWLWKFGIMKKVIFKSRRDALGGERSYGKEVGNITDLFIYLSIR